MRYQGLDPDPVTAMRQVVPLLDTEPRIGEPGRRAGVLTAAPTSTELEDLDDLNDARAANLDAGRLPHSAATRVLEAELAAERDGDEPLHGLSGYELTYDVNDRMADGPHQGWDDRAGDELHEELTASAAAHEPVGTNPWAEAPAAFDALRPVDVEAATALLVSETALLTEIAVHRTAAAQQEQLAATEQTTVRDLAATPDDLRTPLVDEHVQALSASDRHLSVVTDASAPVAFERTAEQAVTTSFPIPVTEVPPAAVVAAANGAAALTEHPVATKQAATPLCSKADRCSPAGSKARGW